MHPARVLPKPSGDIPELYGVRPTYAAIHNLRIVEGRFFNAAEDARSAAVCVLGESAKINLLGYGPAAGKVHQSERHLAGGGGRAWPNRSPPAARTSAARCRISTTSSSFR